MSPFASYFVTFVVLASLVGYILLLWGTSKIKIGKDDDEETGHSWDGITELNSPLPKWWFWTFLAVSIWAIGFVFAYPALGNNEGFLGWTKEKQYEEALQLTDKKYSEYYATITNGPIEEIAQNPATIQTGQRLFLNNCAVCHGSDAGGAVGYPSLRDSDWLYGGEPAAIIHSIAQGRRGVMPTQADPLMVFAENNGLNKDTIIDDTAEYVLSLSGNGEPNAAGEKAYQNVCAACHAPDGTGLAAVGGPNLTDDIWLYGTGDNAVENLRSIVLTSIYNGRQNVMPAHADILSEEKIKTLAAYIYSLSQENPSAQ